MRTLLSSLLVSAGLAIAGSPYASAADLNVETHRRAIVPPAPVYDEPEVVLVRDGCGRGRHFSKWRGVCVWNGPAAYRYGPPVYPAPVYRAPVYGPPVYGYGYYGPPVVYGPPVYGYYHRW